MYLVDVGRTAVYASRPRRASRGISRSDLSSLAPRATEPHAGRTGYFCPQCTGYQYREVKDKVSDREFPMILNCESDFSRIRRVPLEYVLEIPCMIVTIRNSGTESRNSACRTGVSRNVHFILVKIVYWVPFAIWVRGNFAGIPGAVLSSGTWLESTPNIPSDSLE